MCVGDERGGSFGDDGRKRYIYLMVISVQFDLVIKLDTEFRRRSD